MSEPQTQKDLLRALKAKAAALGLTIDREDAAGFKASQQNILIKWLLGQKKTVYSTSFRLSEADHQANFREMVAEKSWGLLPPTMTVEKTTVHGWERSGTRTETSPAGGGKVDYGRVRDALKGIVADAGWQFHLEGGRAP